LKNAEIVCSVDKYQLPLRNTYKNSLNVVRDLWCCKQTVCRVAESTFFLFFRQAYVWGCSWSSAPEF